MALQTDAVDLGVVGFDQFDDVLGGGCFVAGVFNAVVVVVELRGWVCGGGGSEGDGDVGFADGFVEDVLAVGAVVVEGCTLLDPMLIQEELWDIPSLTTSQAIHLPL